MDNDRLFEKIDEMENYLRELEEYLPEQEENYLNNGLRDGRVHADKKN